MRTLVETMRTLGMRCAARPVAEPTIKRAATRWWTAAAAVLAMVPLLAVALSAAPAGAGKRALVIDIDGAIGQAMADFVVGGIAAAHPSDSGIVVLRMNTPGGLDSAMRQIVSAILAAPVPVVTFVAPSGARAASAGTFIAYASALAAMAPGTNIGAATPVALGGGSNNRADAESRKIVNDAIAYIRSLAGINGRNADWAADAVRSAASLPAGEALSRHVIDVIARDVPDLLRQIDGRSVIVAGQKQRLQTAGLSVQTVPQDWRTRLLEEITDPNVAFILMLVGVGGLVLEFLIPGAVLPGLIGAVSLLVALYALSFVPVNFAGAALVVAGIGLMLAELHIGAFGALGIVGIAAFVIGALLMVPGHTPGLSLSTGVIAGAAAAGAALLLGALAALARSRRRPVVTGGDALIGAEGEAVSWDGNAGRVRVDGEIWQARSGIPITAGARVRVLERDGLVLLVQAS